MRIIAGSKRGKKLIEKIDSTTRPTTDRVRENVFNVLSNLIDIRGAKVLDLFAGCGAYGLEAFSRGAAEVTFNDSDPRAVEVIKKNCRSVGCEARILNLDFKEAITDEYFDIVFLDPPYNSNFGELALEKINAKIIVFETEKDLQIPYLKKKTYGRARVYFLQKNSSQDQT